MEPDPTRELGTFQPRLVLCRVRLLRVLRLRWVNKLLHFESVSLCSPLPGTRQDLGAGKVTRGGGGYGFFPCANFFFLLLTRNKPFFP